MKTYRKTKVCTKCEKRRSTKEFYKDRNRPDSLNCWCKVCYREYGKSKQGKSAQERYNTSEKGKETSKKYRKDLRAEMIKAYGGKCAFCDETVVEWLTIDHINGRVERTSSGRRIDSASLYQRLKKQNWSKDEHQLLCHNCNSCKRDYGDGRAKRVGKQKKKDRRELNRLRKKLELAV